jgi:putative membrane protein
VNSTAITQDIEESFVSTSRIEKGDLMQHINRFYDIQGKAERIKDTPFLMIYSAFLKLIVGFYAVLIPLKRISPNNISLSLLILLGC